MVNNPGKQFPYNKVRISEKVMNTRYSTLELLHAKDCFNRITLQITWTHTGRNDMKIKFDRLRLDYGDSRIDPRNQKRKYLTEGLKICE
jgi:hypothetical protein